MGNDMSLSREQALKLRQGDKLSLNCWWLPGKPEKVCVVVKDVEEDFYNSRGNNLKRVEVLVRANDAPGSHMRAYFFPLRGKNG